MHVSPSMMKIFCLFVCLFFYFLLLGNAGGSVYVLFTFFLKLFIYKCLIS